LKALISISIPSNVKPPLIHPPEEERKLRLLVNAEEE